ncbi:hypothetical protein M9H77_11762 [Catharanthus roseus]|uniref:Uncharacterized protein n=1 Tax=Catharanthus roseus TaxID=4058 RepID=A0ACC0BFK5_CATRO|nr:hypothetical protein M9H77_11762 [Catharanthus roseus]
MKPSLLEKSSMVNELLQARIEIDESVKMHVEGEMPKEDFGYSMSDMSFEEEESIEFERKDRVEEKETKHGDYFIFLNSLGTYLERRYFIEFNSLSCASPRVDENDFIVANCVSCVLGVEDRRSMGKDHGPILENLSMSLSLNPPSLCYEVSLEELKSLSDSYNFQVNLIGDMCIISFKVNLFLLGASMTNFLSSHFFLEDLLMSTNVVLDPSCYGFAHLCDPVKTTFRNSILELNLKNLVEKHLVYSSAFVNFLFKGEALNERVVQYTKSCVKIENPSLGATLLYSLTFKEFLDELIFKRELKVLQVLMLNQECSLLNNVLKLFWKKLHQNFLFYRLYFKGIFWKHDLAKERVSTSKDFMGVIGGLEVLVLNFVV